VDSYIRYRLFRLLSRQLSHDELGLVRFLEDVPDRSLHGLGGLDYRQSLIADIMVSDPGLSGTRNVLGLSGLSRVFREAVFRTIKPDHFDNFSSDVFLRVRSSVPPISNILLQILT
jgi:hypothetical protein